jgi:hypothetical protein
LKPIKGYEKPEEQILTVITIEMKMNLQKGPITATAGFVAGCAVNF